jgi:hypothetical protein
MKSLLITCLFLLLYSGLTAQEPTTPLGDNYFFLGLSLPIMKVRDHAHSPQIYQGLTPTLSIGYDRIGQDVVTRFAFSYTMSLLGLSPKTRPKPVQQMSSADVSLLQFSAAAYKRVGDFDVEGWNRYLGGALTFTIDTRSYALPSNNVFGYQINTALNAGLFVQKKVNSDGRFNYEAQMPLLTYALRPNHIGMPPITTGDFSASMKKILLSGKVVTVNKLFRFYNRFSYEKQINDHRKRRFTYAWEASMNRVEQPLYEVMGGVGYESLFKM